MILSAVVKLSLLALVAAFKNPKVKMDSTVHKTGDALEICWTADESTTGTLNIDLVAEDPQCLAYPFEIAHGVETKAGSYVWSIPDFLRSCRYQVRVWGSVPPAQDDEDGQSKSFDILNTNKDAPTGLVVATPDEKSCHVGGTCLVQWNFSNMYNHPADVTVALYQEGQDWPIAYVGTFPAEQRQVEWVMPSTIPTGKCYFVVGGNDLSKAGAGMKTEMMGSTKLFSNAPPSDNADEEHQDEEENKDDEEKESSQKEDEDEDESTLKAASSSATKSAAQAAIFIATLAAFIAF